MFDENIIRRLLKIVVRAETEIIVLLLGCRIDPSTLIPCERTFLVVVRDDVLSKFRSDRFENVSKMADDGEVSEDGVFFLADIKDSHQSQ